MSARNRFLFPWLSMMFALSLAIGMTAATARAQPAGLQVPESVILETDIEYARVGEHRLLFDLCKPKQPNRDPLPLIVYIHGGGWQSGNKSNAWTRRHWSYAETGDYAVASIGYRLTGVAPWPACIHDCKAAIRFLKANAGKFGIDPERIAVWGRSAGGHLVALLCTTADRRELEGTIGSHLDQSSRVRCGIDVAGPTDFAGYMDFQRPPGGLPSPARQGSPEYRLFNGPLDERLDVMKVASPTTYASRSASPLLIVHGTDDTVVPVNQAELLFEALNKAEADVLYLRLHGFGHSAGHPDNSRRRNRFLARHLLGEEVELERGVIDVPRTGTSSASPPVIPRETVLARAAADLPNGKWRTLETEGFDATIDGGAESRFANANRAVWNPRTQQVLFVRPPAFVSYSARDNTWRKEPVPEWADPEHPIRRNAPTWNNLAVDQPNGFIYFHLGRSGDVFYHRPGTAGWRPLGPLPDDARTEEATALVYSPEMNGLTRVSGGRLHFLRRGQRQWSVLKEQVPMGPRAHIAEYNPVERALVLGGGEGNAELHRLDPDGTWTPLPDSPWKELSSARTVLTVDPTSGDLLVLEEGTRRFFCFSFQENRWRELDGTAIPLREPFRNLIAAPIADHGVVMLIQSGGPVLLYKH